MKLKYGLGELEWEKQMHKYWHHIACILMWAVSFLATPYVVVLIALAIKKISG